MNLYDLPKYYDLSYSWNMQRELAYLKQVFRHYTNSLHPRLLEPACGTGRLLTPLVKAGFSLQWPNRLQSAEPSLDSILTFTMYRRIIESAWLMTINF